jgi:hypothetical protein
MSAFLRNVSVIIIASCVAWLSNPAVADDPPEIREAVLRLDGNYNMLHGSLGKLGSPNAIDKINQLINCLFSPDLSKYNHGLVIYANVRNVYRSYELSGPRVGGLTLEGERVEISIVGESADGKLTSLASRVWTTEFPDVITRRITDIDSNYYPANIDISPLLGNLLRSRASADELTRLATTAADDHIAAAAVSLLSDREELDTISVKDALRPLVKDAAISRIAELTDNVSTHSGTIFILNLTKGMMIAEGSAKKLVLTKIDQLAHPAFVDVVGYKTKLFSVSPDVFSLFPAPVEVTPGIKRVIADQLDIAPTFGGRVEGTRGGVEAFKLALALKPKRIVWITVDEHGQEDDAGIAALFQGENIPVDVLQLEQGSELRSDTDGADHLSDFYKDIARTTGGSASFVIRR